MCFVVYACVCWGGGGGGIGVGKENVARGDNSEAEMNFL